MFGLWLQLGTDCRLGLNNVQYATYTYAHILILFAVFAMGNQPSFIFQVAACHIQEIRTSPWNTARPLYPPLFVSLSNTHLHTIFIKPTHDSATHSEWITMFSIYCSKTAADQISILPPTLKKHSIKYSSSGRKSHGSLESVYSCNTLGELAGARWRKHFTVHSRAHQPNILVCS